LAFSSFPVQFTFLEKDLDESRSCRIAGHAAFLFLDAGDARGDVTAGQRYAVDLIYFAHAAPHASYLSVHPEPKWARINTFMHLIENNC